MKQQTIEQRRAAFALERIGKIKETIKHGEFRSYSRALPAMIHTNGLGQAMAFCKSKAQSKNGKTYGALYDILSDWLTRDGQPLSPSNAATSRDLLECMAKVDMYYYRVAQAEALALMEWVRKFAVAFLDKKEEDEAKDDSA